MLRKDMVDIEKIDEENYLLISGIQHYVFCRRQWSIINIEHQWQDNVLTIEGDITHQKCHNENFTEAKKKLLVTRGMRVYSSSLGATGQCDIVEFHQNANGAVLYGREGYWLPVPIEYKHGKSKTDLSDKAQLCAQAMCLEEMLCCKVPVGYIYYAATHRREKVINDNTLREFVKDTFRNMRADFRNGRTLTVKPDKKCKNCSLNSLCLSDKISGNSVKDYYHLLLGE